MPIAVGLLIGVLGVLWVDPKTTGGAIILIAVGVLVAAAIGRLIFSLGKDTVMPTREEVRETIADAVLEAWANLPPRKASSAEYADEIIEAITAAGYAIVPVEPTEAMINACERAWHSGEHRPQYLYKAILAASEGKG